MTDGDLLRLEADLLAVMRTAVTCALESGAEFVAPAHVVLGLLADARIGPAIAPLISREDVLRAARDVSEAEPGVAEIPEVVLPDGETPFARRDTVAFLSRDAERSLYLDAGAFRVFLEGARRATGMYRAKHLVFALTAEAVKERELLELLGRDPQAVTKAVDALG